MLRQLLDKITLQKGSETAPKPSEPVAPETPAPIAPADTSPVADPKAPTEPVPPTNLAPTGTEPVDPAGNTEPTTPPGVMDKLSDALAAFKQTMNDAIEGLVQSIKGIFGGTPIADTPGAADTTDPTAGTQALTDDKPAPTVEDGGQQSSILSALSKLTETVADGFRSLLDLFKGKQAGQQDQADLGNIFKLPSLKDVIGGALSVVPGLGKLGKLF